MCGLTREVNQLVINSRARLFTSTAAALADGGFLRRGCGGAKSDEDGGSAVESCVDTSGDTVKLGFLNSLTGPMAISEKTVSSRSPGRR